MTIYAGPVCRVALLEGELRPAGIAFFVPDLLTKAIHPAITLEQSTPDPLAADLQSLAVVRLGKHIGFASLFGFGSPLALWHAPEYFRRAAALPNPPRGHPRDESLIRLLSQAAPYTLPMGLDWHPAHKPKPNCEREFERLFLELACPERPRSLLSRLRSHLHRSTPEADLAQLELLGMDANATLQVPRIGMDPAADAWARDLHRHLAEPKGPEAEFLASLHGSFALGLLPACDGVPFYTREGRTDFRAQLLTDCEIVLGAPLLERCFHSLLADELAALARELRACTARFAEPRGLAGLDGQRECEADSGSAEGQAHLLYSATRWAEFWSSRGHGMVADW